MMYKNKQSNIKIAITLLLLLAVYFVPSLTYADTWFTPNEGDISLNILSQLFGDLIHLASGGEGQYAKAGLWLGTGLDPFQTVLRYFNYCCLFVGGLLGAYAMAIGLIGSAKDGVPLGKELSNPYFWLRTSGGIIFIMPLPMLSGYCLLQLAVAWVIIQSVGIADTTWKAWNGINDAEIGCSWGKGNTCSDKIDKGNFQDLYALKMPSPQVAEIAYKTFEGYTCVYGLASQNIKRDVDNAKANQSVNNTTSLNTDYSSIMASLSAEKGASPVVVAGNSSQAGLNTGNVVIGGNNGKTEAEIEQMREKQRLDESQRSRNLAKERYNSTRNTSLKQLDNYVQSMGFKTEYNATNFTNKSNNNKIFRFGVGSIPSVGSGTKDNVACGFIDFGHVTGSVANQRLYDSASRLQVHNGGNMIKNTGGGDPMVSYQEMLKAQKNRNERNGKIVASDKEKVLDIYAAEYKSLHDEIRNLAKNYVNEVNEKIRFPAQTDERDAMVTEDVQQQIKAELLIKYNDLIQAAYTKFEQKLIQKIYTVYMDSSDDNYKTNRKRNGSSITALTANNDFGNYVNFIKIARDNAVTDGWATAGMWYMSMTQSISKLHELTSFRPQIGWASNNARDYNMLFVNNTDGLATLKRNIVGDMIDYYGLFKEHAQYSTNKSIVQASNTVALDGVNTIAALGMNLDITNMFDSNRHPVILLTETGHNLINAAQNFIQLNSYWEARNPKMIRTNDGKVMPDPNNPASQASVMLSYFAGAIMVMGFMMAYYLPALPFLIWTGAMLGWLIAVFEAIVIAPLWGAMHLHPEGSKYTGKGQAGYGLLVSLALRPVLMILGLIASLVIVQVFGMFVNYIFAIGMNVSLQPNDTVASDITVSKLMYILSMYGIYMVFMMGLITKMFNIMTIIPDQILKWVGGSTGNLSEYGSIGGDQTYGKLSGLAGNAGNAYATKLKERGTSAGLDDLRSNSSTNLTQTHAELSSSNVPIAGTSGSIPASFSGRTVGDRQRFFDTRNNLQNMAIQAGMSSKEAEDYANEAAMLGYNDPYMSNATKNWSDRGVMTRSSPEEARAALNNALEAARNNSENSSQAYLQSMTENYVKNVSNSNAPITGNRTGFSAGNTNVAYSGEIIQDGTNHTPTTNETVQHSSGVINKSSSYLK